MDYFLFDYVITFDENNADAENEIGNLLSEYGLTHIRGLRINLRSTLPDNRVNSPCLLVTDSKEDLDKLFHIKFLDDQVKDKEYVYSEEFLDQYFGVGSGDSYEVTTINGQNPKLTIDNVFAEYTITHYFIMDGPAYEKYFDVFRSCNVGSKSIPWNWCCNCAKCLFVYIIISPFLSSSKMVEK